MPKHILIVAVVVVLGILFFAYMRFACTGIYDKVLAMYKDELGQTFEVIECWYVGWETFHFELDKKWFDMYSY